MGEPGRCLEGLEGKPVPVGPPLAGAERGCLPVRGAVLRHGHVVCHGGLEQWARAPGPPADEVLGMDGECYRRYRATHEPVVRARLLGSRLLLRHAVAAAAGMEPHRVVVGRDERGRPVVREPAGLDAGISHTAALLVVGVARGRRIGVDVEAQDRLLLVPGLPEKICHPEELAQLRELPPAERNPMLVRLWTLKEAYTKALGLGLAHDFSRLHPRPSGQGGGWWLDRAAPGWQLRCDRVMERFLVARALGPGGL